MEKYIKLGQKYAEWRGKKFGIAVNTGTGALHLSLVALGIKEGDEVIQIVMINDEEAKEIKVHI